jgi:hypothetical protein
VANATERRDANLVAAAVLHDTVEDTYDVAADFAVLCANCHRMIHHMDDPSNLSLFRANLSPNKTKRLKPWPFCGTGFAFYRKTRNFRGQNQNHRRMGFSVQHKWDILVFSAMLVTITMTALYLLTDFHRPASRSGRNGPNSVAAKTPLEIAQSQSFPSKTKTSPGRIKCIGSYGCIN